MKMVINQLEGILTELKDVAKELREVRLKICFFIELKRRAGEAKGSYTWWGAGWVYFLCELLLIKYKNSMVIFFKYIYIYR